MHGNLIARRPVARRRAGGSARSVDGRTGGDPTEEPAQPGRDQQGHQTDGHIERDAGRRQQDVGPIPIETRRSLPISGTATVRTR